MQPQNPYDQILNPAAPPKKPFLFGAAGKPKPAIMVLFVLLALTLIVAAYAVFSSLTSKNYDSVVSLAQRQEEIIRISELGLKKATDPSTMIYLATVRNVTQSEQTDTMAFLKKKGQEVSAVQLALKKDSSIDTALNTAEQNNTYDDVLLGKLNGQIVSYQRAIRSVTVDSSSKSEKALFETLTTNAKTIAGTSGN
jgi:hypothetical protein